MVVAKLTQHSKVTFVGRSEALSGTETYWLVPLRLKACPTWPAANVAPLTSVPLLVLIESVALPSAAHQLTRPAGGVMQAEAGLTVRTAFELIAVP